MGNQTISSFCNDKGQNIFFRNWKSNGNAKAIVLIIHGLNSHSGWYENFAEQLNENTFEVYAMDLIGRGQSDGERYYIPDYKDILSDIDKLLSISKSEHPTLSIFLLGHSAGGVFASAYAVNHQEKLQGLVSESFAFEIPAPGFILFIIKLLSHVIPHTRIVKLNSKDFSRDPTVVNALNNDPLLANEKQPAKTMQQLLLASEFLKKQMHEIKLPLLLLHGTEDKATKPSGSKYFMVHASSSDKELKLYEGYYHDLINDKDNDIVIKDIVRWANRQLSKQPT